MEKEIIDSSFLDDYREVMGDQGDAFVRELVKSFIDDTSGLAELLAAAWEEKDQTSFVRAAHSLKTTSKTMGANLLSERFENLEHQASMGDLSNDDLFSETLIALEGVREELTRLYID
jgi:HPt (histidine-containing phosphotransfer) domain-containing protein